jgi:hypothetical protein
MEVERDEYITKNEELECEIQDLRSQIEGLEENICALELELSPE